MAGELWDKQLSKTSATASSMQLCGCPARTTSVSLASQNPCSSCRGRLQHRTTGGNARTRLLGSELHGRPTCSLGISKQALCSFLWSETRQARSCIVASGFGNCNRTREPGYPNCQNFRHSQGGAEHGRQRATTLPMLARINRPLTCRG